MYGIDGMSLPVKAVFPHAHRNQLNSGQIKLINCLMQFHSAVHNHLFTFSLYSICILPFFHSNYDALLKYYNIPGFHFPQYFGGFIAIYDNLCYTRINIG